MIELVDCINQINFNYILTIGEEEPNKVIWSGGHLFRSLEHHFFNFILSESIL
jgi:hypothetical protein